MYSHAPKNYQCPFCLLISNMQNEDLYSNKDDIFYQDESIIGFISSHWRDNIEGIALIAPVKHVENLYDMDELFFGKAMKLAQKVAICMREKYPNCKGITLRQNNEPEGNQDVWHFHLHVIPRFNEEELYKGEKYLANPAHRKIYADVLKNYFKQNENRI